MKKKIIIAITGASGSVYAKQLLHKLNEIKTLVEEVALLFSENGKKVWEFEIGEETPRNQFLMEYKVNDFFSPVASGSANYDAMIIIPCSMGTLGKIAHGTSDDLIIRAADVMLKEKRKLILVPREAPYNLIHIENMKLISLAGGIICPASPSFYSKPETIADLVNTIVDRVLHLAGFNVDTYQWGKKEVNGNQ